MSLFRLQDFIMHSGAPGYYKIECDALTDDDLATLARIIAERVQFGAVHGIPRGGVRLEAALRPYATEGPLLIVDDVLTAGTSMAEARRTAEAFGHTDIIGVVVFARGKPADWITPVFQMW